MLAEPGGADCDGSFLMKIADVEFHLVEIPRGATSPPVRSLVVRLSTDQGHEGWGEGALDWRPGELAARRSALLPALVGHSVFNVAELAASDALATSELRAAIEMAHWDLLGRVLQQPLCHLWGGVYRQRIPLVVRLPALPAVALPEFARELADCGYPAQILASGGDVAADLALATSLRETLGSRSELRFDAQGRYRFDDARRLAEGLAEQQFAMLLDPLAPRDAEHRARFARQSEVPVGISAELRSPQDVLHLAREEGVRAVIFAPERLGGLSAVRNAAAVADAAGLAAALGGRPTLGLGVAARLQLAAALPRLAIGNECAVPDLRDDILAAPLVAADGMLTVPGEPGLGVTVDRAQLERWQMT